MLHWLRRHPLAMSACLRECLAVTYAFPEETLRPLVPPGLALDTLRGYGFVAIALVQAEAMRPAFLPARWGGEFFLSGYRLFTRLGGPGGSRRGLRILRSDTDRRWMVQAGNLLTHYRYQLCQVERSQRPGGVGWSIRTPRGEADLEVYARLEEASTLPEGSPFTNFREARRFAGPLPYTFEYEPETRAIIQIRGVRSQWEPRAVAVEVTRHSFFERAPFEGAAARLANAFLVKDVRYRWLRGVRRRP